MFVKSIVQPLPWLLCVLATATCGCSKPTTKILRTDGIDTKPKSTIVALVGNKAIRKEDMWPPLIEIAGEEVLRDLVLDLEINSLLHQQGIQVTSSDIETERILFSTISPEMDQQALDNLLEDKGVGKTRLKQLLWRNAALRKLVRPDVSLTDDAVRRMFSIIHGPSYPVKIIVVTTLDEASELKLKSDRGDLFSVLAMHASIDSSATQGGAVGPISLADPAWPAPIREALPRLGIGESSEPIFIGDRWVILRVTGVPTETSVTFESVEPEMRRLATLAQERFFMESLAHSLRQIHSPRLFDPVLKRVLGSNTNDSQ